MADAIWNNNYLLSNMNAQKLYAQSPLTTGVSGTSAYIGIEPSARYNETVLFSVNTTGTTAISLSEPLSSFERFIVYGGYGSTDWPGLEFDTSTNLATSMNLLFSRGTDGGIQWFKGHYNVSNDTQNITAVSARRLYLNEGDTTLRWDSYSPYIKKIVGINRKENG